MLCNLFAYSARYGEVLTTCLFSFPKFSFDLCTRYVYNRQILAPVQKKVMKMLRLFLAPCFSSLCFAPYWLCDCFVYSVQNSFYTSTSLFDLYTVYPLIMCFGQHAIIRENFILNHVKFQISTDKF